MVNFAPFVLSLFCLFDSTESQYTQFNKDTHYCDGRSKTALVEHFFNLILTEFQSTPPACVCVQMCANQPTYCYPNGCFKRKSNRLTDEPEPVSRIQNEDTSANIFIVEQKKDFIKDFTWEKNPEDIKRDKIAITDILPDPFKDKYQMALRYKKTPKGELKYNLREQVRNTKADLLNAGNIGVSKTRWPSKKHTNVNRHMFPSIYDSNPLTKVSKFFMSVLPDKDVVNYPPRYTKRELKKVNDTEFNAETFYTPPETNNTVRNIHFSIDKLINDLIENNPGVNNEEVETNVADTNEMREAISNKTLRDDLLNNVATNNILFMNSSTEDLDRSKYVNAFNEMIADMSYKIDIQNNTSLKMMERLTGGIEAIQGHILDDLLGNKSIDRDTTATNKPRSEIANTTIIKEVIVAEANGPKIIPVDFYSANIFLPNDNATEILKRNSQRVIKVLRNAKTNVIS